MQAVLCKQYGPPQALVVEEVESRELRAGEVRVRVEACGVNFPDNLIIEGKYQYKPDPPFSPGGEVAGQVIETGPDCRRFRVGEPIMAMTVWGGFAEEIIVPEERLIARPEGLDAVTAAGFTMAYGTTIHALKQRARLQAGETLLVLGAGGGVGLAAVDLGKAMGAHVIAAASSEEKLAAARDHGADELVDYSDGKIKDRIKALTGGKGVDVIYDPVGTDSLFDQCLRCLGWQGRHLVVGFAGGEIPRAAVNLVLLKGSSIVGVFWGDFIEREPDVNADNFRELFALQKAGKISPLVSKTYSLAQAPEALNALANREVIGKIVLTP